MMLTIHGLPLMVKYHDLKTLIKQECNLTDFILDNLAGDVDGCKKVRIGVADEGEGAHLCKCLNGFRMGGNVLRVVPVGKMPNQQGNFDQSSFMGGPNQHSNFGNQPGNFGNQSGNFGNQYGNQQLQNPWNSGPQGPQNNVWGPNQTPQMRQNNFDFQQRPNQFAPQQSLGPGTGNKPFGQSGPFNQNRAGPADQGFGFAQKSNAPHARSERTHVLRSVEILQSPVHLDRYPDQKYEQNKPGSSQMDSPQQGYSTQGSIQPVPWSKLMQQPKPQFGKPDGPFDNDKRTADRALPQGSHDSRPSPHDRRDTAHGMGGPLRPPDRRSPPGRRMSPGRRSSPSGRRSSPSGRRGSPGRRASPSERRAPPRKSPGRGSPHKRPSPDRRGSPARDRYSPSRRHDKPDFPDSRSKQIRPAYEPDSKAANQAKYSDGYRPNVHENVSYPTRQMDQRGHSWQDKSGYTGMKKPDDDRRAREPEKLSPGPKTRSPTRRDARERSPLRDRYRRHSPSPRSPRRSWALEKRRSPEISEAPPPPVWPGQNQDDHYSRNTSKPEPAKQVPVWDHRTFDETEAAMRRDHRSYVPRDAVPPNRREPSPRRHELKPHDERNRDPKFDPRDAKFEPRDPKFDVRDPKFDTRDPKFDVRNPKFEVRDPKFDARDSKFDARDPKFDVRDPKYDVPDPKFELRDSKFDVRDPKFDVRDPKFDVRDPKFDVRDPKFDVRDPKFDIRDPKYESREPKFEPRDAKHDSRDPKFDPHGPKFEVRPTRFDVRDPKFDVRDPKFDVRDPKFDVRDPKFDVRDPKFDVRDPKFDVRDPKFDLRDPKFDVRDPKFEQRDPKFDARDPKFDVRDPKFDVRDPKFEPHAPEFRHRDPKFEERDPKFQSSRFEPRGPNFDLRDPKFDQRDSKFDNRGPKFEPRDPKFDVRDPKYEPRDPKYDARNPKFEPRDPKYEVRGNEFAGGYDPERAKFQPRNTEFEPRDKYVSRDANLGPPRDSKFEPRESKFKPTFEPVEKEYDPREHGFKTHESKYESRDSKYVGRDSKFEQRDYKDRRDEDVTSRKPYLEKDDYREKRPDLSRDVTRREDLERRDDRKDSRKTRDPFDEEFEDIYKRTVEFKQKVEELKRAERKREELLRESRRREEDENCKKIGDDRHHRDDYRKMDLDRRPQDERPLSRHSDERREPDWKPRDSRLRKFFLPLNVKAKRDKAVDEIANKMMHKYGNFEMSDDLRGRVCDELKLSIARIMYDMFGDQDISFIELVVKFNGKHGPREEVKIFEDVMTCFPKQHRIMKRPAEDVDKSPIPEKSSRLSDDTHLKQVSDWNISLGPQTLSIPIGPILMNQAPMMVPSPFSTQDIYQPQQTQDNVFMGHSQVQQGFDQEGYSGVTQEEAGYNLYLCKDDFKPFSDNQADYLKKFLIAQIFRATASSQGWAPDFTLRGLQSSFRYEVHTMDQTSKDWLLNLDFNEFTLFSVLVYTKEELWYERAAIWLPGHSRCRNIEPLDKIKLQNKTLDGINIGKWKLVKKIVNVKGTRIYVDMPPSSARALEKHKMMLSYELQKVNVFLKAVAVDKDAFDSGLLETSISDQTEIVKAAQNSSMPVLKEDPNIVKLTLKGTKSLTIVQARKIKEMVIYHLFKYLQQNGTSKTDFVKYGFCAPDSLGILPENYLSKRWLTAMDFGRLNRQPIVVSGGDEQQTRYLKMLLFVPGEHNGQPGLVLERLKQANQGVKGINFALWKTIKFKKDSRSNPRYNCEVEVDLESAETISKNKFKLDYLCERQSRIADFKPDCSESRFAEKIAKYKAELTDKYDVANMDIANSDSGGDDDDDVICLDGN